MFQAFGRPPEIDLHAALFDGREPDLGNMRIVDHVLRKEAVHSLGAAEPHTTVTGHDPVQGVEHGALHPVLAAVNAGLLRFRVEPGQAGVGAEPEVSLPVLADGMNGVPGVSEAAGVSPEPAALAMESVESVFGPDPESPLGILEKRDQGVVADAFRVLGVVAVVGEGALFAVEPGQAVSPGGQPDGTRRVLEDIPGVVSAVG